MRLRLAITSLFAALLVTATPAHADLPLTVEGLITDQGKVKLDLSLAYANVDDQGVATGEPIIVQTGPASFAWLPTLIGERIGNSDTFVATLGLRYGLTAKAEIYTRMSGLSSSQRVSGVAGTASSSESRFADAWARASITNSNKTRPARPSWALPKNEKNKSSGLRPPRVGFGTDEATLVAPRKFTRACYLTLC